MKLVISLLVLAVPGIASAQMLTSPQPTMNEPNYTTSPVESFALSAASETPTMKRQKLARAWALRAEAAQLLADDGGTFTLEHRVYVESKRRAILGR